MYKMVSMSKNVLNHLSFQYSGVYSPSRATSPHSDDEENLVRTKEKKSTSNPPLPSEPALLKPGKVLGSDQAKRRLQAFARFPQLTLKSYICHINDHEKGAAPHKARKEKWLRLFKRTRKLKPR